MWVLPLGLESKLRRLPWASVGFVGATVAISVVSFDQSQLNIRSRIQSEQKSGYVAAQRDLYLAECRERDYSICDALEKDWEPQRAPWTVRARWKRSPPAALLEQTPPGKTRRSKRNVAAVADPYEKELKEFLTLLHEDPAREREQFKTLATTSELARRWESTREEYFRLRRADLRRLHQLTPENVNLASVAKAQFTHGSWSHLLGNMVVLAITLPFVEMRLGWLAASLLYLSAGLAGLMGYTFFMPSDQSLLGASAGVSAILGAFLVLFSRHRIRLWVSFFGAWNKVLTAPVLWSVPALFLASDLAGAIDREGGSVAHGAHLLGFVAGMLVAWSLDRFAPLPAGMSFPDELDDLRDLKAAATAEGRDQILERWWRTNPSGALFREYLKTWLLERTRAPQAGEALAPWSARLLGMSEQGDLDLGEIPPADFFRIPWRVKDRRLLIANADRRLRAGDWARALCLYDAAGDQSTSALILRRLTETQRRQLATLNPAPALRQALGELTPEGRTS